MKHVSRIGDSVPEDHEVADAFLQNTSDVVTVVGADGTMLYASPSVEGVLRRRPEELVGRNVSELLHPEDLKHGVESFICSTRTPDAFVSSSTLRCRHRDGGWRWFETMAKNLLDDPSFGAILCVSRDVTEREVRVRAGGTLPAQDFLATTFLTRSDSESPSGFRFEYVGSGAKEMLGYAPEEFYADPTLGYGIIHPEDRERVAALYDGKVVNGEISVEDAQSRRSVAFESRVVTATGRNLWVRVQATVIPDEDSEGRSIHGIFSDITGARLNEARALEGEWRYGSAFRNASCGLALSAPDLTLINVNRALCEMIGYSESELLGLSMGEITHPEDLPASEECVRRLVSGESSSVHLEKRYVHRDGRAIWVLLNSSLVRDDAGEPSFFVASCQDISESKELNRKLRQSEERFRALVHKSSEMVSIVEVDGTLRYASPALEKAMGYDPEVSVDEMNVIEHIHPDDQEYVAMRTAEALAEYEENPGSEISNVAEFRFRHADGSWRHLESVGTYLLDHPAIMGVVINSRDVTDRKSAEARLRQSEEHHRRIVETVREIIFECDENGRFIYLNPAWERIMGYKSEETVGRFPEEFVVEDLTPGGDLLTEGNGYAHELTLRTRDGRLRTFEVSFAVEPGLNTERDNGSHRYAGAYVSLHDVTDRKELERKLERQALHDPLTDLPNRRFLMRRIEDALTVSHREGLALLFVDIDDFKNINDTMGHEIGDEILRAVAGRISNTVRSEDTVARLGGEEFVVLMPDGNLDTASAAAERMLTAFERPFSVESDSENAEIAVSLSIGVTLEDPARRDRSAPQLLHAADLAMYRAKESGGSRWRI